MENDITVKKKNVLERLLDRKVPIIIFFGIAIRCFMLFYYYFSHVFNPGWRWGDIENYYNNNLLSTPLTILFLDFFRLISFGSIELFVFWAFLCDLFTVLMFFYVLKNFEVEDVYYAFGLFLINGFFFLNNSFSLEMCGYNITDAFFYFFFFLALMYYPKKELHARYLFYLFLGLSICIKYYTLPSLGFFFLKFVYEKDWKELKIFLVFAGPPILIFIVIPFFLLESYFNTFFTFTGYGLMPLPIRVIPISAIFIIYSIFRLRKAEIYEILIVSTVAVGSFFFFSVPYVRWFQFVIFYGILSQKELFTVKLNLGFITRDIEVNNHLITFYLSLVGVVIAFLFILYVYPAFPL